MQTYAIQQKMLTNNQCYKLARRYQNGRPTGIVIHSNGVQGVPAAAWPDRWNNPSTLKAVHAHIDERDIVQALPWDIQGWHAGGSANGTHLGVELSEPIVDTAENFAATWDRAVFLCVLWCRMYKINEHGIIDHSEAHALGLASNHGDVRTDPNYTRVPAKRGQGYFTRNGRTMNAFRAAVAAALAGSPPDPNPPPLPRTIRNGDRGDEVTKAQTRLNQKGAALAVDGVFGPKTEAAARAFQRANGLVADGIIGPRTWAVLLDDASKPIPGKTIPRTIRRGDTGPEVRQAQTQLNRHGSALTVDGIFGPKTEEATRAFQKKNQLEVDGIIGPKTWAALL